MSGSGVSVLVVDDDQRMCRLARRLLTQQGYNVAVAATVQEARALMQSHKGDFQLLIADVVLPELDGRSLAEELQRMSPDLKVLYMSGYGPDMLQDYNLRNAPNLIHKPFDVESLLQKIKKVLR